MINFILIYDNIGFRFLWFVFIRFESKIRKLKKWKIKVEKNAYKVLFLSFKLPPLTLL